MNKCKKSILFSLIALSVAMTNDVCAMKVDPSNLIEDHVNPIATFGSFDEDLSFEMVLFGQATFDERENQELSEESSSDNYTPETPLSTTKKRPSTNIFSDNRTNKEENKEISPELRKHFENERPYYFRCGYGTGHMRHLKKELDSRRRRKKKKRREKRKTPTHQGQETRIIATYGNVSTLAMENDVFGFGMEFETGDAEQIIEQVRDSKRV